MLLLYSRPLCAGNAAIQRAYAGLSASLARRGRLLAGRLLALESYGQLSRYFTAGRSCAASVLAAPLQAREAVRAACMASEQALAQAGALGDGGDAAAGAPASTAAASHERLCLRWQPLRCGRAGRVGAGEWGERGAPRLPAPDVERLHAQWL